MPGRNALYFLTRKLFEIIESNVCLDVFLKILELKGSTKKSKLNNLNGTELSLGYAKRRLVQGKLIKSKVKNQDSMNTC